MPTAWRPMGSVVLATLLAACGGGSPAPGASTPASALTASRQGELVEHVRSLLRARATQRASTPGAALDDLAAAPAPALVVTSTGQPVAHSNTTVQEAGVDEEDLLKTNGTEVFALDTQYRDGSGVSQLRLLVHRRRSDGGLDPVQTLPLPADASAYPAPRGLLLAASAARLVVLSESITPIAGPIPCPPGDVCPALGASIFAPTSLQSTVQAQFADLGAAGATLGTKFSIEGRLIASRMIGNVLYLVTTHTPRLPVEQLPADTTTTEREAQLARLTATDFLPMLRDVGGAAQPLVLETDCYLQPRNASLALTITTITAVDLGTSSLARASRCFVGGTEAAYVSPSHLYLATTRSAYQVSSGRLIYPPRFTTDIHKFAFNALAIDYRASGEVNGHLGWDAQRKPYRMGEHASDLRVLSYTGETGWATPDDASRAGAPPPSPATLTLLRERAADGTLQPVATLPNAQRPAALGKPGEQIYAVRFVGERAYLVTFRQIDPLYVLDLADASDPRVAGVLDVPGFSDFLFPLPEGLLFGVGKDADAQGRIGGVKVALFDVRDAAQPKAIAAQVFGARGSQTALDYSSHGLNLFMRGATARIALPMRILPADFSAGGQQGLYRFEVDTAARTFATLPVVAPASSTGSDLWGDRSLQIESQVVYLSQGRLVSAPW